MGSSSLRLSLSIWLLKMALIYIMHQSAASPWRICPNAHSNLVKPPGYKAEEFWQVPCPLGATIRTSVPFNAQMYGPSGSAWFTAFGAGESSFPTLVTGLHVWPLLKSNTIIIMMMIVYWTFLQHKLNYKAGNERGLCFTERKTSFSSKSAPSSPQQTL